MARSEGDLAAFVADVCGEEHLRVEDDLGDGFVRLRSSEAERRQAAQDIRSTEDIVIELLRNARDAHARNLFLAATREGTTRRLVMIDDGDGVPERLHERIFEPRVTSKLDTMHLDKWGVHGRGMALFSIAANARKAFVASSAPGKGSAIVVETDLERLGEKADQSSFPRFELSEDGSVRVLGPRNIQRTACEFAIEARHSCSVFLGSATDIAATLYAFGLSSLTASIRAFCTDSSELPVCKRLAVAPDPCAFVDEARALGLVLSERSARRVMDGRVEPVAPIIEGVRIAGLPAEKARPARRAAPAERGPKIEQDDLDALSRAVKRDFSPIARDYYLEGDVDVRARATRDAIHLTIPLVRQP